jgi:hypothetical protein
LTATETDGTNTLTGAGGTATFSEGSNVLGTVNVVNGVATFTTLALSAGVHNYSVLYSGDAFDQSSNFGLSSPLVVTASTPAPPAPPAPAPAFPASGVTSPTGLVNALQNQANPTVFTNSTINVILALINKSPADTVHFDTTNGTTALTTTSDVLFVTPVSSNPVTITAPAPVVIFQGLGNVNVTLNNGNVNASSSVGSIDRIVVGNNGNDHIQIADATNTQVILGSGNNTVSSSNGHAVVINNIAQTTTDISKIQYVQLDNGNALIFAKDSQQAAVTALYETTFGRTADHGGLQYWFDLAASGASLSQIADAFTHSTEFAAQSALPDSAFIQSLYQHTFGRAGEDAGIAYWADALSHGASRADLITAFASIAASNIASNIHTEAQIVGGVTIVHNIV